MPQTGIVVTNTFATQSGNVPASQLDTNFSQGATALNALGTYGNYFVDGGSANAISVSVPSPLAVAYAAGLPLQILVAATNTGATTITVNSLGAVNLINPNGTALSAAQVVAGGVISVVHDGTYFQLLGSAQGAGVTSLIAGTGIGVSAATGNVTVSSVGTSGTFTGTLTGLTTSPTGTITYAVDSTGQFCTLSNNGSAITGNASSAGAMGMSGLPTAVQPAHKKIVLCTLQSGGLAYTAAEAIINGSTIAFALLQAQSTNDYVVFDTGAFSTSTVTDGMGLQGGWTVMYGLN